MNHAQRSINNLSSKIEPVSQRRAGPILLMVARSVFREVDSELIRGITNHWLAQW